MRPWQPSTVILKGGNTNQTAGILIEIAKGRHFKKYEEEKRLANLAYDDHIAQLKAKGLNRAVTNEIIKRKVVNRFSASGFGIWNCDRPLPPDRVYLAANFKNEKGQSYANQTAFLVDKSPQYRLSVFWQKMVPASTSTSIPKTFFGWSQRKTNWPYSALTISKPSKKGRPITTL